MGPPNDTSPVRLVLDPLLHCPTEGHPTQHRYYRRQITETTEDHVVLELLYQCRLCKQVRPWGLIMVLVSALPVDLHGTPIRRPRGRPKKQAT